MNSEEELAAVALLAEPVRRRLYDYLRDAEGPVGREEAASNTGISAKLAAFHLDRMATAGLLDVEFGRLTGRVGPGAGRPAKLYRVSSRRFSIAVPETGYTLAASIMATALSAPHDGHDGVSAVEKVASGVGRSLGAGLRQEARTKRGRRAAVERTLAELGYHPQQQRPRELVLGNCIFAELADSHCDLVCRMNSALIRGLLEGAELPALRVEEGPREQTCCVHIVAR